MDKVFTFGHSCGRYYFSVIMLYIVAPPADCVDGISKCNSLHKPLQVGLLVCQLILISFCLILFGNDSVIYMAHFFHIDLLTFSQV